jgi:hypothetical protein
MIVRAARRPRSFATSAPILGFFHAIVLTGLLGPLAGNTLAQTSATYTQKERALNQAGHPTGGIVLVSPGFRITLDAVGDGLGSAELTSPSYGMSGGIVASNRPPGEVRGLRVLSDRSTMVWDPERSIGDYNVYRGSLGQLPGTFGSCRLSHVPTTTASLTEVPPPGPAPRGFYYLVTAENRLAEEGTKGFTSAGSERANAAPCP